MSILYTELLEKLEKYANVHERGIFEAQADRAVEEYIAKARASEGAEDWKLPTLADVLLIVSLYVRARR